MPKKIVGLDIDDVLIYFNYAMTRFHNENYGTTLTREELITYHFERLWKCTREEMIERVVEFYYSKEHEDILPMDGAFEVLTQFRKKLSYVTITARPESVRTLTMALLRKHYGRLVRSAHFLDHLERKSSHRTKAEVCKEVGAVLLVEDSLDNARIAAEAGIPVVLIDMQWNQSDALHPLITRVFSWKEIEPIFASL